MDWTLPPSLPGVDISFDMLESLKREPWRYSWLSLLRRISADPAIDPVGTALRPGAEPFRLGQMPDLSFAPSEIADAIEREDGRLFLRLFSMGMLGPNGPLPVHLTEIAREREFNRHDSTLIDFFDVFHHRFMTLFFHAWASTQATVGLDRAGSGTEIFSLLAGAPSGHAPDLLDQLSLPSHAQLAASAHTVRENHDIDGMRQTIAQFFGVPVEIEPFVFHWMELPEEDMSRLGAPGEASTLGGAVLGEVIPDRQHRFRIVIGPLELPQYLRFTPEGEDLPLLVDLVRSFTGKSRHWQLDLRLKTSSATPATLGSEQQLGYSTWLGENAVADISIRGMRFEPEREIAARARPA